jgi:glutaredoxin 3
LGKVILGRGKANRYLAYLSVDAALAPRLFPPRMELKLYSREWCSWCIDAKEYLTEKGYRFTEINVGQDRQAYEEMKELSDQTYVPTFVAGDKVLANFDTDQLEKFLRDHEINP